MTEEYMTLKEFIQELKKSFKYVRLLELEHSLKLENHVPEFKRMILVSNELEEYTDSKIEMKNIKALMKTSKVDLLFFMFIPILNIPLFHLKEKNVYKTSGLDANYTCKITMEKPQVPQMHRFHSSLTWESAPIEDWDDHIPKIKIFQKIDDWITKHIPVFLFRYYLTIKFKYLRYIFEVTYYFKERQKDKKV